LGRSSEEKPIRPKIKKLKQPRPEDPFVAGERMAEVERRRLRLARGRSSTILTGGMGDRSSPMLARATLGGY